MLGYNKTAEPSVVAAEGIAVDEMSVVEMLQSVIRRKLTGVMLHDDLQTIFDYLNLHGFKREQEYRTMSEFAEFKSLCRYIINRYEVMPCKHADRVEVNPSNIKDATSRASISSVQKKQSIKWLFETWAEWEEETISILESYITRLVKLECNADAEKLSCLLLGTTCEYKYLARQILEYCDVEWSLHHIYTEQEELHEHFKNKMKEEYKIDIN